MSRQFLFLLFIASALPTMAQGVSVKNEISVEASTGGNNASRVQQGKSVAEVFMKTTVNGDVVQEVKERKEQEEGEDSVSTERDMRYEVEIEEPAKKQVKEAKPFAARILEFFRGIFAAWFS